MNQAPYPLGDARSIAMARANGLAPAETVMVSMVGRLPWPNPTAHVEAGKRYRWDWVKGLGVVLVINAGSKLDGLLADIDRQGPKQLDVIDIERRAAWLINGIHPRLSTCRWPQSFVDDWLGPQVHHIAIRRATAEARDLITNSQMNDNELEAAWS